MEGFCKERKMSHQACPPILLMLLILFTGCRKSGEEEGYEASVRAFRESKDRVFITVGGPLTERDRGRFSGLRYYPPDSTFRVRALYRPVEFDNSDSLVVDLADSKGEIRRMRRMGSLAFSLPGDKQGVHYLYVLRPTDGPDSSPYVSFIDPTNGETTYEAGRYLDVELPEPGRTTIIDFNYAYNPYCAYNQDYSCPLVYRPNVLSVPIEAGERVPEIGH